MTRHLAAILAADVVGYSSLMNEDEMGRLAALRAGAGQLPARRAGRQPATRPAVCHLVES